MKILLFTALIGASSLALADVQEFDAAQINRLEYNNSGGNLAISVSTDAKAKVSFQKKTFESNCKMAVEQRQNTLFVNVESKGFLNNDCDVDFQIVLPKNVALDLDTGSGDITIKGTSGDLNFRVGSGTITADAEIKNLDGKTGSGDINLSGLTTGGQLKAGSGDLDLTYTVAPSAGVLDIKTGSGDAEIVFPKNAKIHTSFAAGSGELVNALGNTPNSAFKVSMKAGSGDLEIKTR